LIGLPSFLCNYKTRSTARGNNLADKLIQIAELVYKKTKAGEIKWERTLQRNMFQTSFPNYSILIQEISDGSIAFKVCNEKGEVIEELTELQAGTLGFMHMRELYVAARRGAMDVDQALDELLRTLGRGR
jgi:hypothetical protein